MNKRGAYFFVIDAFIAVSIIIAAMILIFSAQTSKPESQPALSLLQDYMDYIANTEIRDLQGAYSRSLLFDGNITKDDNTILDQIVEFYYTNQSKGRDMRVIMTNFINETSYSIIPESRSFSVRIYNDSISFPIYNRTRYSPEKSSLMISNSRIVFKRINQTEIFGPLTFEVRLWV